MTYDSIESDNHQRAVVLGGSVAGLFIARVLADRFPTVIVVERDHLPDGPQHRRGVPQAHQIHALLAGGQQAVEELLPGITRDLELDGAPVGDPLADMEVCFNGHRFRRGSSGLTLVSASRRLLEHHIRRRVLALPGVTLLDNCDAVGLIADAGSMTGVRILRRADNSVEEAIDADLVVDATGRGSRVPIWLADLGYQPPAEERVAVGLGYATRCYRMPPDALDGAYGAIEAPSARRPSGLALSRLEDDVWMLTLVGLQRNQPGATSDGFRRYLRSVGVERLTAVVERADPIDEPRAFRFPASARRRYEHNPLPDRLLIVGDALCSFNPIYGQGISVAALEALAVQAELNRSARLDTARMMRVLARIVDVPWQMTGAADRPFVAPAEVLRLSERLLATYIDRVQRAATTDTVAGSAFLRVSGLVDHPRSLLRPAVLRRAVRRTSPEPPARRSLPTIASNANSRSE